VPTATSTVKAHKNGRLCDGKIFDSTDMNGGEPIELSLDRRGEEVDQGLQLIGKGGKIHLWVPAELGYGEQGSRANTGRIGARIRSGTRRLQIMRALWPALKRGAVNRFGKRRDL